MQTIELGYFSDNSSGWKPWLRRASSAAISLSLAVVCLVQPLRAQDQAFDPHNLPIASVRVEGNVTIPTESIEKHIKTRPGRPATVQQIKEDVETLVRTRWFMTVEPRYAQTEEGYVVVFRVVERPILQRVEYQGNDKIKTKYLEALTGMQRGSPYDVSANREAARRIESHYHDKGYAYATVELVKGDSPQDREAVFQINEGPKVHVSSVRFKGNDFFSSALLKTKLATKTRILWMFGGKYDPATIDDDIAALKRYYNSLGFFDVAISHRLGLSEDRSKVTIEYEIDEGVRYQVASIRFKGNRVVDEQALRENLTLAAGEMFTARKVNNDVNEMLERYGELGRLNAKVDAVPYYREEEGVIDLEYQIDEDKVYRVRQVNVHVLGDSSHTRQSVALNMSTIHSGDLADPKQIQRTQRRIEGSGIFGTGPQDGPRVEIAPVTEDWLTPLDPIGVARGQTADLPAVPPMVTARPSFGFSTPDGAATPAAATPAAAMPTKGTSLRPRAGMAPVMRQETSLNPSAESAPAQPGLPQPDEDLLGLWTMYRGQNPDILPYGSDIFNPGPGGDPLPQMFEQEPPEWIDLDYYLTEGRTGRLMFGVGVNSDAGVVGNIVLEERNFDLFNPPRSVDDIFSGRAFRGAGQQFRLEATPGSQVSRYVANWQDPFFMDTDYSLGVSGFFYQRFFLNWDEERLGGRINVGRQLTPELTARFALRLENVNISDPTIPTPPILARSVGDSLLATGRVSLAHDTRDAAFAPSEGHFVEVGYEQGFGDDIFPRFDVDGKQYFTVYSRPDGEGKHILSVRGQMGWTGDDTPIYERYYAGGFQSFRGFDFRGVSPVEGSVRVGGNYMMLGGVEYMFPVTADGNIQLVAFSDFGTVDEDVSLDKFRLAVGGGIRLTIPAMGPVPIAFDWAVPVLREDFDDRRLFSFYVGLTR